MATRNLNYFCGAYKGCGVWTYGECEECKKPFRKDQKHYLLYFTHTREMLCEKCWKGEAGILWRLGN